MKLTQKSTNVYLCKTLMFCAVHDVTVVCNVILVLCAPCLNLKSEEYRFKFVC